MAEETKGNFLASSYYRGALNVNDMRHFDNEQAAHDYISSSISQYGDSRVYELFSDKPPRLCKRPK